MNQARIRPAQVGASTAAAVGAAFLAARLGVYGTVIGVGVISLVTTVGGEMLLRSLERTKQAARTTNLRPRIMGLTAPSAGAIRGPSDEAEQEAAGTHSDTDADTIEKQSTANSSGSFNVPETSEQRATDTPDTVDMATTAGRPTTAVFAEQPSSDDQPPKARRWMLVTAGFAASFALALAVVAGIEVFTGSSLAGEGKPTVIDVLSGNDEDSGDPSVPTPTDEPSPTRTEGEPTAPADDSAPDNDEDAAEPDEQQTPAPGEQEPPSDTEESLPPEETTPPDDEEDSPLPEIEPSPEP